MMRTMKTIAGIASIKGRIIEMTQWKCKYCGIIEDEFPSVEEHIKCASRYLFKEIEDDEE